MEVNFGIGLVMIPVVLFIFMLPIALLVALQVWLCKRSPKMGLILPGVSLALSLLLTLSMASFSTLTVRAGNTLVSPVEGGVAPAQEGVAVQEKTEFHPEALVVAGRRGGLRVHTLRTALVEDSYVATYNRELS